MTAVVYAPAGRFGRVDAAAYAEQEVDWQAPEGTDQEACVLSFAAVEIAAGLRAISGVHASCEPFESRSEGSSEADVSVVLATRRSLTANGGDTAVPAGLSSAPQSFVIDTDESDGRRTSYRVVGADATGALYGAYELLARLGFRWFSPDPWDAVVPPALDRPAIHVAESPSFVLRGFWATDGRGTDEFLLWMARNKLNLWSAEQANKAFCRKLGIKFTTGGHAIFARYADPAEYFGEHPDWYGLRDGRRSADITGVVGDNICFANEEVRRHIASELVEDLIGGAWKWVDLINVWALDNGRYCQCDECAALGNPTDQILLLAHDCRAAILRARADGRLSREVVVSVPAYHESLDPPSKPLPADFDHDGIVVTFFPIERCFVHSFADPACAEINQDLVRFWERWTANPDNPFRGAMLVGEYYNVSSYAAISALFVRTMAADIPYYFRTGARMMHYMHVPVGHWGTLALTNHQFAAQLWNHTVEVDRLVSDYFARRYGEADASMRRAYRDLERALENAKPLKHYAGMARHTLRKTLADAAHTGGRSAPIDDNRRTEGAADTVGTARGVGGAPESLADQFFTTVHLQYDAGGAQSGMALSDIVATLDAVCRKVEAAEVGAADPEVCRRIVADLRRLRYTRNSVEFYYRFVRLRMFEAAGAAYRAAAAEEAAALRDIGEALRRERVMPKTAQGDQSLDWYRFYTDGLTATWLAESYEAVMARYELADGASEVGRL